MFRIVAIGAALGLAVSSAAMARPLEAVDWLDWERAADAQVAPDGSSVAYVRQRVDKMTDGWSNEVWMMDVNGGKHRHVTDGSGVRWSPDGTRIAFTRSEDGKTGIYVRWMDAEGAVSRIAHNLDSPTELSWSPDGRSIAFAAKVKAKPDDSIELPPKPEGAKWAEDATVIDALHYRMDRIGHKKAFHHIFVVSAEGGTPRQITKGGWDVGNPFSGNGRLVWTPDGGTIVFQGQMTEDDAEAEPFISHIYKVALADGAIRRISPAAGSWSTPALSPDGKLVAYAGSADTVADANYPAPQLRVVGIDGGNDRILVEGLPAGAGNLTWESRSRAVYYTVDKEGSTNIQRVDLDGRVREVTKGVHRLTLDSTTRDGSAFGIVTAPQISRNLARIDLSNGNVRQLTDLNADILADVELGEVEEFWTDSSEGTRVQGWIVKPPAFDPAKTYKTLLYIHGGPHAMYGVNFQFPFQAYAARDYVVIYSNPRGSTGYGPEFGNAIDNRYPGQRDFDDLMAATDEVVRRGYVDESRMFVAGCSGGGVLTSWTVSHTDRFAAAAALCPVINWISFAGTADIVAWAYKRFRPDFWENPQMWLDHSPLMHANKVKTPTLLMTGNLDLRTPLSQAEEFYSALKYFGVPTRLVVMKEEWHGTSSKPSNMLRTIEYLDSWFTEHSPGEAGDAQAAP